MTDDYQFDVFISYRRKPGVKDWVTNHFLPVLSEELDGELPNFLGVFKDDVSIETGANWPATIKLGLQRSKVVVAVLTAPYFSSNWCMAEWASICKREEILKLATDDNPNQTLVYPIPYADGEHYCQLAKRRQCADYDRSWSVPEEVFRSSTAFIDFRSFVRNLALKIARRIEAAPPYEHFPVEMPDLHPIPTSIQPIL